MADLDVTGIFLSFSIPRAIIDKTKEQDGN